MKPLSVGQVVTLTEGVGTVEKLYPNGYAVDVRLSTGKVDTYTRSAIVSTPINVSVLRQPMPAEGVGA